MKLKNTTTLAEDKVSKLAGMVEKDGASYVAASLGASRHAIERAAKGEKIHAETARLLSEKL